MNMLRVIAFFQHEMVQTGWKLAEFKFDVSQDEMDVPWSDRCGTWNPELSSRRLVASRSVNVGMQVPFVLTPERWCPFTSVL